jgi:hypothetical protein
VLTNRNLPLLANGLPEHPDDVAAVVMRDELIGPICKRECGLGELLVLAAIRIDPRHPIESPGRVPNVRPKTVAEFIHRNRHGQGIVATKDELAIERRRSLDRFLNRDRIKVMGRLDGRKTRKLVLATEGDDCSGFTDHPTGIREIAKLGHLHRRELGLQGSIRFIGVRKIEKDVRLSPIHVEGSRFKEGHPERMYEPRAHQLQRPITRVIGVSKRNVLEEKF